MHIKDCEKYFWNNCLAVLAEGQIKHSSHTWYVRYCETFIRANKETRPKQQTKDLVCGHLSELIMDIPTIRAR